LLGDGSDFGWHFFDAKQDPSWLSAVYHAGNPALRATDWPRATAKRCPRPGIADPSQG